MVNLVYAPRFKKHFSKIKDLSLKSILLKQIRKIKHNPTIGKPLRYSRKSTRELYLKPFRISYSYNPSNNEVYMLDVYHKDQQ